ncbi:MAG: hypothetical protein LBF04_01310 [Prevotellaceae bacterium]|jgi:hypothetical protein|nr:hypothetical protein [Prevotellaceae bacterium]
MKKLILISIIFICAGIQSAKAQNTDCISDSAVLKCFDKNADDRFELLAYCEDTAKQHKKFTIDKKDREKIHKMLDEKKKEYYTKEMNLTEDEAKVFFPILDQFESKHRKITHERKKLSHNFEIGKIAITDAEAKRINKQWFDLQKQEFDLMLEYMKIFETILSPKKLFLFHKAHENFMRELIKSVGFKNKNLPPFNFNGRL